MNERSIDPDRTASLYTGPWFMVGSTFINELLLSLSHSSGGAFVRHVKSVNKAAKGLEFIIFS